MEDNSKVANVQIECIKFDVNLIVCFDIEECKYFVQELYNRWDNKEK